MSDKNEAKPQIKLNRKMRMWNKYRVLLISAAVVLVVVIAASIVVKSVSGGKNKGDVAANITTTAEPAVTEPATEPSAATTAAEPTTQEATTVASTGKLTVSGTVSQVQFTSKDFYENTVFLGDSVVSGISTYGYLDNVYGNVNATSAKLESYVSAAIASKPSKVFIMVGHNDANYGTIKEETVAENIISLVEAIHKGSSTTKVYVLSLTPVTSAYEKKTSSNVSQSYLDNANSLIEQNASSNSYTYIDVASAYKDSSGYLNTDCTGNGINLTSSYYPFLLNGIAEVAK